MNEEITKLNRILGGVKGMGRLPDAVFIIDTRKERLAIQEALRLEIPVIALLDTNSDPDEVQYPIPANDDAIRAVRLLTAKIADAIIEGKQARESSMADLEAPVRQPMSFAPDREDEKPEPAPLPAPAPALVGEAVAATPEPAAPAGMDEAELAFAPAAIEE